MADTAEDQELTELKALAWLAGEEGDRCLTNRARPRDQKHSALPAPPVPAPVPVPASATGAGTGTPVPVPVVLVRDRFGI